MKKQGSAFQQKHMTLDYFEWILLIFNFFVSFEFNWKLKVPQLEKK